MRNLFTMLSTFDFSVSIVSGCSGPKEYNLRTDSDDETSSDPSEGLALFEGKMVVVRRCATDDLDAATQHQVAAKLAMWEAEKPPSFNLIDTTVPVYFHIIKQNATVGDVTAAQLTSQINVLNAAYAASGLRFAMSGTPSRTINANWHNKCLDSVFGPAMKTALHKGTAQSLNVYICNSFAQGNFLGEATFPASYARNPMLDGVVVDFRTLPRGSLAPYNLGDTLTHEAGHWAGLYHTFQGGCSAENDSVSDTPAERAPSYGCPALTKDTCPSAGRDPVRNFMNYVEDSCMTGFTSGQKSRVRSQWQVFRAGR